MVKILSAHSALEDKYCPGVYGETSNTPRIFIQEIRDLNLLHISGNPYDSDFLKTIKSSIQYDLPLKPNTTARNNISFGLWLSPSSWLIGSYKKTFINSLMSRSLNVTDISSGRTILRISGSGTRDMLAKGCPLDLHPEALAPGSCAQSKINSLSILLNCIDNETIDVFIPRSFSITFWEWILRATQEYGLEVKP